MVAKTSFRVRSLRRRWHVLNGVGVVLIALVGAAHYWVTLEIFHIGAAGVFAGTMMLFWFGLRPGHRMSALTQAVFLVVAMVYYLLLALFVCYGKQKGMLRIDSGFLLFLVAAAVVSVAMALVLLLWVWVKREK